MLVDNGFRKTGTTKHTATRSYAQCGMPTVWTKSNSLFVRWVGISRGPFPPLDSFELHESKDDGCSSIRTAIRFTPQEWILWAGMKAALLPVLRDENICSNSFRQRARHGYDQRISLKILALP